MDIDPTTDVVKVEEAIRNFFDEEMTTLVTHGHSQGGSLEEHRRLT